VIIVWVSAVVSAFIDNIPYTAAMIPIVNQLVASDLGLPLRPLVWALGELEERERERGRERGGEEREREGKRK